MQPSTTSGKENPSLGGTSQHKEMYYCIVGSLYEERWNGINNDCDQENHIKQWIEIDSYEYCHQGAWVGVEIFWFPIGTPHQGKEISSP